MADSLQHLRLSVNDSCHRESRQATPSVQGLGKTLLQHATAHAGEDDAVIQALMRCLDVPKASLRVLCGFMAMHMAIEARSGKAAAKPVQQALTEKLLQVLAQPACSVTEAGEAWLQLARVAQPL